jgi:CHAD domain-containing protein
MSRAVELVFEIEPKLATEWLHERAERSRGAKRKAGGRSVGPAIAEALKRIRGVVTTSPREALTVRVFEHGGKHARLMVEESSDERRVMTVRAANLAPGVTLRDNVHDMQLEPGMPLAASDALPPEFKAGTSQSGDWAPAAPLAAYRTVFLWHAPAGLPVEIALLDALDIAPERGARAAQDAAGQSDFLSPFCELRLSCACDNSMPDSERASDISAQAATSALFAAAQLLVDRLPAFPVLTDAYARAAGETFGAEPLRASHVALAGARTPHEALIAIAGNVARQWFGNERGARESGAIEFVHQMRVSLRRAKTLLRIFPRWADEAWQTRVAPGLKWLGEMLGEARDLDVFVDSTLPALAAADADSSAWSSLIATADARRLEARATLQQALRSRRYAQLSLAWLEWLANQRFSAGPPNHAERAVRAYAAKRVRRHFNRLTADPPLTSLDAAGVHRRRIEAKRLRYTLEFFEPLVAPGQRRKGGKQLSQIQTVLGEASDAAAALRFLESEHFDVTPYQRGFVRGWYQAVNRSAASEGERLIRKLRRPKLVRNV